MSGCCTYSFADLYYAAFGRTATAEELAELYALPHEEKNEVVRGWAARAGWVTRDIVGTDGRVYASFGPG